MGDRPWQHDVRSKLRGPAGDLLYRFGNPEAYGRKAHEDDPAVFTGSTMSSGFRKDILRNPRQFVIYNNGDGPTRMHVTVPRSTRGHLLCKLTEAMRLTAEGAVWSSKGWGWSYTGRHPNVSGFYSPNISGVQPQPNGNYLDLSRAQEGDCLRSHKQAKLVWEYINPGRAILAWFSSRGNNPQQNSVFRARTGMDPPITPDLTAVT